MSRQVKGNFSIFQSLKRTKIALAWLALCKFARDIVGFLLIFVEAIMKRAAATKALTAIWNIDPIDSGDESPNEVNEDYNSDTEQTRIDDSTNDSNDDSSDDEISNQGQGDVSRMCSEDKNKWIKLEVNTNNAKGRCRKRDIFRVQPGVVPSVKREATTEVRAFNCFISENIKRQILKCTVDASEGALDDLTLDELDKFFAIEIARGVYGKNHSVKLLWSEKFGIPLFRNIMCRNRYEKIKRFLRFDEKRTRSFRIDEDPFTHVREIFDKIAKSCRENFVPNFSLCIDEQLVPMKTRCRFVVYMPNKPDKFGFKFWLLVDNSTKYVWNIVPYLGKCEAPDRNGERLADFAVKKLLSSLERKSYNITCDNFFTSVSLANYLSSKQTTLVGTVRTNSRGLPEEMKSESLELHETCFYYSQSDEILALKHQGKQKKSVCLLTTMHVNPKCDESGKRKPFPILFYNKNKCGVDAADSMLRLYSTRAASRRWPVTIWHNMLDVALLNSWIVFKESKDSEIPRKVFLLNLVEQLACTQARAVTPLQFPPPYRDASTKRKYGVIMCKNRRSVKCRSCGIFLCGSHCDNAIEKFALTTCANCL